MKKVFILAHDLARKNALEFVKTAPDGYSVTIAAPTRNLEQNAKFHALCGDIAKSKLVWQGKSRTAEQWKVLLISGHSVVTKQGAEIVPGLEGEFVNIRESSATMSRQRISSLIEYSQAFLSANVGNEHEKN